MLLKFIPAVQLTMEPLRHSQDILTSQLYSLEGWMCLNLED